jgi:hypothetical protein
VASGDADVEREVELAALGMDPAFADQRAGAAALVFCGHRPNVPPLASATEYLTGTRADDLGGSR